MMRHGYFENILNFFEESQLTYLTLNHMRVIYKKLQVI